MKKLLLCVVLAMASLAHTQVSNPVPAVVASVDSTGLTNNVASTPLMASAPGGMYLVQCFEIITTAAGTSSTLPNCMIGYTNPDTQNPNFVSVTNAPTGNTISTSTATAGVQAGSTIYVKAGTALNYQTLSYASVPSNAMTFNLHLRVIYVGQ